MFRDYTGVIFPANVKDCARCHVDDRWKTKPSALACGTCHDSVDFKTGAKHEGGSEHAGKPGARWGWLIYWIGFDNFKAVSKMPENKRKDVIQKSRHAALQAARQAISVAPDTTVESAEKAGLLAIH